MTTYDILGSLHAAAVAKQQKYRTGQLNSQHWLLAAIEKYEELVDELAPGLGAADFAQYVEAQLEGGICAQPLSLERVKEEIEAITEVNIEHGAGKVETVAAVLRLSDANKYVADPYAVRQLADESPSEVMETADDNAYYARYLNPTPTLDDLGIDLTEKAVNQEGGDLVARVTELELAIETLCRRTKRNPVLVGPAGVGKTAIVEGLARHIVEMKVPHLLDGVRIVALQPSIIVAGASTVGEVESRVKKIILEASQDGIILFIDEIHSMVNTGGAAGTGDIASLFKPALARGNLALIGATTDDEYRQFVERDSALERRFQPIRVQQLSPAATLEVLRELAALCAASHHVTVSAQVLSRLIALSEDYMKNRNFPDKAIDLLEQSVAHAIVRGSAAVSLSDAEEVTQRMLGMPLEVDKRLASLDRRLWEQRLMDKPEIECLVNKLSVSMRGFDVHSARPNATAILMGETVGVKDQLAATVAECLFGARDRVVRIDFSRFVHATDIAMLTGAPPGFVGYSDRLPIHALGQMPWCVALFESVDTCHPNARSVLAQALHSGFFTDSAGKRVFLSDAVVIMTVSETVQSKRSIGFAAANAAARDVTPLTKLIGQQLVDVCDVVVESLPAALPEELYLRQGPLKDIDDRFAARGKSIVWSEEFVEWLLQRISGKRRADAILEREVLPLLVKAMQQETCKLQVSIVDGKLVVAADSSPR